MQAVLLVSRVQGLRRLSLYIIPTEYGPISPATYTSECNAVAETIVVRGMHEPCSASPSGARRPLALRHGLGCKRLHMRVTSFCSLTHPQALGSPGLRCLPGLERLSAEFDEARTSWAVHSLIEVSDTC